MPMTDKPEDNERTKNIAYRIPGLERTKPGKSDPPSGKRMGIDLFASIAACAIVGALADRAFGTAPWCFILTLLFGLGVGLHNVWRITRRTRK